MQNNTILLTAPEYEHYVHQNLTYSTNSCYYATAYYDMEFYSFY